MLKKHFLLLSSLKTVVLLNFGEKCCDFFQDSLTNSVQKEQHLFETEIFYNIINVISIN